MHLDRPLCARNGQAVEILTVCRVSDPRPGKQDEKSLDDQGAEALKWAKDHATLAFNLTVLAGKGSGECLDRAEFIELQEKIASGRYDVVLTEDLSRIARRIQAMYVCKLAEDHGVRLIAVNDHVDTALPNWRDAAIFAAWHHERSNRDTSDRIKRTNRNRFLNGGCLHTPLFGYVKPPGVKHDSQMHKDPSAERIYVEWFARLERGASFAEIADWLNETKASLPPGARDDHWTPRMVTRHTYSSILKGIRERNHRKTRRVNSTGKYKSIKAGPQELLQRPAPHLAFFTAEYYDRVVAKVKARNAKWNRDKDGNGHPRKNIPKKRIRFPGQIMYCGCCGRMYVFGGHGQTNRLMCNGARGYACWNGVTVDGPLAANRIAQAVFAEIEKLEGFDPQLLKLIHEEAGRFDSARSARIQELDRQIASTNRETENVVAFVRQGHHSVTIRDELDRLEKLKVTLVAERSQIEQTPSHAIEIPPVDQLEQLAREAFAALARDSFEFARLMRVIIPKIVVFPVRLCDRGPIKMRARFRLHLTNLLPDQRLRETLREPFERVLTVDLFDPPQREEFRQQVVSLRAQGMTEREVADTLGTSVDTAQDATQLQREIHQRGIIDPYVAVTAPPDDIGKLRRHLHRRYRFDPLPDAGQI